MGKTDFCTTCRKKTKYTLKKVIYEPTFKIEGVKPAPFEMTVAICEECGKEMQPSGLLDKNIEEFIAENKDFKNKKVIETHFNCD